LPNMDCPLAIETALQNAENSWVEKEYVGLNEMPVFNVAAIVFAMLMMSNVRRISVAKLEAPNATSLLRSNSIPFTSREVKSAHPSCIFSKKE
jgi:hypothetical protein